MHSPVSVYVTHLHSTQPHQKWRIPTTFVNLIGLFFRRSLRDGRGPPKKHVFGIAGARFSLQARCIFVTKPTFSKHHEIKAEWVKFLEKKCIYSRSVFI